MNISTVKHGTTEAFISAGDNAMARQYIYLSDIQATRIDSETLLIEPLGMDLDYEIRVNDHGVEYADFPAIDIDLFSDPTVSLSLAERDELKDYLDRVARRVE